MAEQNQSRAEPLLQDPTLNGSVGCRKEVRAIRALLIGVSLAFLLYLVPCTQFTDRQHLVFQEQSIDMVRLARQDSQLGSRRHFPQPVSSWQATRNSRAPQLGGGVAPRAAVVVHNAAEPTYRRHPRGFQQTVPSPQSLRRPSTVRAHALKEGDLVEVTGMTRVKSWNGKRGQVVGYDDSGSDKVLVKFVDESKPLAIPAIRLELVDDMVNSGERVIRIPLEWDGGGHHYGVIKVGGQEFNVVFDSGSSDLVIPSKACNDAAFGPHQNRYDPSKSSTYIEDGRNFSAQYVSFLLEGIFSTDTVTIGGMDIPNVPFAEMRSVSDSGAENKGQSSWGLLGFDGILGLGLPGLSMYGDRTVFDNLMHKNFISEPVFAFFYSLDDSKKEELIIGGIDRNHYTGELVDVPLRKNPDRGKYRGVTRADYWDVNLEGIKFGDLSSKSARMMAIFDSGCDLLAGPAQMVDGLAKAAGAELLAEESKNAGHNIYGITFAKATALPDLEFTLAGHTFVMKPEDYVFPSSDDQLLFGVTGLRDDPIPMWILGKVFMRKFYVVHDQGKQLVRIAPLAMQG